MRSPIIARILDHVSIGTTGTGPQRLQGLVSLPLCLDHTTTFDPVSKVITRQFRVSR